MTTLSMYQFLQAIAACQPAKEEDRPPTINALKEWFNKNRQPGQPEIKPGDILTIRTPAVTEGFVVKTGYNHALTEAGQLKLAEYEERQPAEQTEPVPA